MAERVLICNTFGGFGLSRKAVLRLRELGSKYALAKPEDQDRWYLLESTVPRTDPLLLQVFDEMGQDAAGKYCILKAVEIPDGVSWHIEEYDGSEWVAEDHRTWPSQNDDDYSS